MMLGFHGMKILFHYDKNLHGILGLRASFVANTHVFNTYISKSPALLCPVQENVGQINLLVCQTMCSH